MRRVNFHHIKLVKENHRLIANLFPVCQPRRDENPSWVQNHRNRKWPNTTSNYAKKKRQLPRSRYSKLWKCATVKDCFRIHGKFSIRSCSLERVKHEIIPWKCCGKKYPSVNRWSPRKSFSSTEPTNNIFKSPGGSSNRLHQFPCLSNAFCSVDTSSFRNMTIMLYTWWYRWSRWYRWYRWW